MSANNEQSRYTPDWLRGVLSESKRDSLRDDPALAPGGHYHGRPAQLGVEVLYSTLTSGEHGEPMWLRQFKEDEIARAVNELRRLALEYGGSQQLRERITYYLAPILRGERRP